MITDNMIDENSAKYKCVFAGFDFEKAKTEFINAKKSKSDNKKAVQLAIDLSTKEKTIHEAQNINEGFFSSIVDAVTSFLKSPPAWVEEPTGFNDPRPENVFNDVEAGVKGYNNGTAAAAATSAAILGRKAIPSIVKSTAKFAAKHPIAATGAAVAISHPKKTAEVIDKGTEIAKDVSAEIAKNKDLWKTISNFFKPVVDFAAKHPTLVTAIGATCYGLLQTYPLWWPYLRRMNYELTSGDILAACIFEANDTLYKFEYSLSKNRWVLLASGKIASQEDSITFLKTKFANRFINRCKEILNEVFDNEKYLNATSMLAITEDKNMINKLLANKEKIKSTMFNTKILS